MASPAWERRNARAQARGYASYYDYRAHEYGRRPPSAPRARGARLAHLRGHRSGADLSRALRSGRVELVNVIQLGPDEYEVLTTWGDGSQRTYRVKGKQLDQVQAAITDVSAPP